MNRYFENFRTIRYNNALAIDITQRAAILADVFSNNYAFYPYRVKNGMRAEQIAEKYYGNSRFEWLVYFSNNIVDPYHEWTMDDETFIAHVKAKYGSLDAARAKVVKYRVNWYEDTRELAKVQFDSLPAAEKKYWVPKFDTYGRAVSFTRKEIDFVAVAQDADGNISLSIPEEEQQYWSPVSAFDIEEEENAKKANIRLLDSRYAATAEANIRKLLEE